MEVAEIKKRSVTGVLALTSRTGVLQLISFTGTFLLTIFLSPEIFGIFFVVSAIVAFLNYFSDIGLAAALVQSEEIDEVDYKTTFTIQQILVSGLVIVALLTSNKIAAFYDLSANGLWLFRALVLAFFLASLKTIPSVILERKLDFNRLVIPQIVEVSIFYLLAVYLAWQGWGIVSFTVAVLARGIGGLLVMYVIQPWVPGFAVERKSARKLLSFGAPFQLNSLLGLVKDDLFTIFLGKILPFAQVGYIGWAKKWAETPLRLIMDSFIKVTFPTYSRLQEYSKKLTQGINKTAFFSALFIFPLAVGLVFLLEPLVFAIPKYQKWEPALFSFYFFVLASVLASISTPLTNALNAIGKVKVTVKLMIMWTVLTWALSILFIQLFGFNGVAVAFATIGFTVFVVVWVSKKYLSFALWENIKPAFTAAAIMGIVGLLIRDVFSTTISGIIAFGVVLTLVYAAVLFGLFREKVTGEIKSILEVIRE